MRGRANTFLRASRGTGAMRNVWQARSMTRTIRPSTPADAAAIVELLNGVGLRPNVGAQALHWKYWQAKGDSSGFRSFVLTDGSQLLAHGANVDGFCSWGKRRLSTVHMIDWAARRGEIGAGTTLMKSIAQQTGALLAIGGSDETLRLLPHIGFRSVGKVTGYVRALYPLRLLRSSGSSRRLPRFARGLTWILVGRELPDRAWQARRIATDQLECLAPVLPAPRRGMAVLERSVESFRYALSCPIVPMHIYAIEQAGHARGYFLLASAPGQVRIADCWMDSDEPAAWLAMVQLALEQGSRDPQAAEIVAWANDPLLSDALEASGFRARHETLIQMRPSKGALLPDAPLRVQMLDNDLAYLHEDRDAFWT
jgi:hypothetical protein